MNNVLIEKLDHQGRGIARINNKTCFIENALPSEIVDIKITLDKKKYSEGNVIKFIKKSDDRINPICPYFFNCGGCNLMHMSYEDQLMYKENKVKEIIDRYANLPFHIDNKIGYYAKKSSKIIEIDNCYIVDDSINDILNKLKNINLKNIYEIVIRSSKNISNKMIVLKINKDIDENNIILSLKKYVDTIIIYQNRKYKTIYGKGYIFESLGEYKFKISPDSFFQVNTVQAENLYNKVLEYANLKGNENVLDLYCGTGTIGIYLSKYFKKVLGVEINKYAVEDADFNKDLNSINNIEFKCLDASRINQISDKFDTIIVDPPRSGLDKETVEYLKNSLSKKIVYVSCDPITLARDLKLLSEIYDVKEITPFDMFSNTYHVECVCVLNRKC